MKGRLNSTVAMLAGVNLVALFAVLYLAFSAGKSSAGEFDMANPKLLAAAVLAFAVGVVVWWMLSAKVTAPLKQLADYSEKVAAGDYKSRIAADSPDDFGYIADNLNRASERASRAVFNQEAQENLQRSVTDFLTIVSQIARGDLTLRGKVTNDALGKPTLGLDPTLEQYVLGRGITSRHLTLSHERSVACAFVVLEGRPA